MVEFALVVPVLVLLIVGVFDTGRIVLASAELANAVREGAREGVTDYPASGWEARAESRARSTAPSLDASDFTVSVAPATDPTGTFVTVTGEYHLHPIAPYVTMVLSDIPMSSTSRMFVR